MEAPFQNGEQMALPKQESLLLDVSQLEDDYIGSIDWQSSIHEDHEYPAQLDSSLQEPPRRKARKRRSGQIILSDDSDEIDNIAHHPRSPNVRSTGKQITLTLPEIKQMEKILRRKLNTPRQIADHFRIPVRKVYHFIDQFRKTKGNLYQAELERRKTHPQRTIQFQEQKFSRMAIAIREVLEATPKLYQQQIKHILEKRYGLIVSQSTISRCMGEMRFVKKKPQRIYVETNTQSNIRHRQQYCEIYLRIESKCMFLDECGINNRIRREKGWVRKGTPFHCEQPSDGANKYSVLAAISFEQMHQTTVKAGAACSAQDMVRFITDKISDKYLDYVLILDNAKIHKTAEVKEALAKINMRYLYLPPYSPLLNPIQCVFHQMKGVIRDQRSRNPEGTLKQAIDDAIAEMYTRSFTNYERRIRSWAQKGLRKEKFDSL